MLARPPHKLIKILLKRRVQVGEGYITQNSEEQVERQATACGLHETACPMGVRQQYKVGGALDWNRGSHFDWGVGTRG